MLVTTTGKLKCTQAGSVPQTAKFTYLQKSDESLGSVQIQKDGLTVGIVLG